MRIPRQLIAKSTIYAKAETIAVSVFFTVLLFLGLSIYRDFGVSVDEPIDNYTGLVNAKYVLTQLAPSALEKMPYLDKVEKLETYQDRQYGALFQTPATIIPYLLGYTDSRDIYFFRHLANFIVFFFGVLAFYWLVRLRVGNWLFALGAVFALVLSPRIFADAFYNSKDIIFLTLMVIGWGCFHKFRLHMNSKWAVIFALISAAALNIRIMAFMLPGLTFLWILYILVFKQNSIGRSRAIKIGLLYLVCFAVFLVGIWPFLWEDPYGNFQKVFSWLKRNGDPGFAVLYWGKGILFTQLPWHYLPAYILITTPIQYLVLFLTGVFFFLKRLGSSRLRYLRLEEGWQDLTALLLLVLPVCTVIITKSIIYDGWRHLYFVYPAILYFAVTGAYQILMFFYNKKHIAKNYTVFKLLLVLNMGGFAYLGWIMVSMHPYYNVYFSVIPAANAQKKFDLDYWGLSYREGFAYILKNDKRSKIKIATNSDWLGVHNLLVFHPHERERVRIVKKDEADYFLTEYRFHPQPYTKEEMGTPLFSEIYTVQANGLKILSVFKLK